MDTSGVFDEAEMITYSLAEKADLSVYYDVEILRYDPEVLRKLGLTRKFFMRYYVDCPSLGFLANGEAIGGMIFDRDRTRDVHFAVQPAHHGKWKSLWLPALDWLFAQQDPVYASIESFNHKCIRFMDRQGWERVSADHVWTRYRMTADRGIMCALDESRVSFETRSSVASYA